MTKQNAPVAAGRRLQESAITHLAAGKTAAVTSLPGNAVPDFYAGR